MGFAERLTSSVVTDNLASNDLKLMPVDFVASLSGATETGSDIMRSANYDGAALRRALLLLTKQVIDALRIGRGPAMRLSVVALNEILHWQCRTCNAAGQVVTGSLKVICPTCEGTGTHRWSDHERAKRAGIDVSVWSKWEKKYIAVLDIARVHSSGTIGLAKKKMGD